MSDIEQHDGEEISRSHDKREAEAAQAVGERLIKLNKEQLKRLDLPETLHDAVLEAQRLTSNGALRRQRQYIGKVMRDVDPAPILAILNKWDKGCHEEAAKFHHLEKLRDRLLADDKVISDLLLKYPHADVQRLRTLIRNAHKELAAGKPPKSSRELFKELRQLVSAQV